MTNDMQRAKARLDTAIRGLDLSEAEVRTLAWLTQWETTTVDNIASVIEKARRS